MARKGNFRKDSIVISAFIKAFGIRKIAAEGKNKRGFCTLRNITGKFAFGRYVKFKSGRYGRRKLFVKIKIIFAAQINKHTAKTVFHRIRDNFFRRRSLIWRNGKKPQWFRCKSGNRKRRRKQSGKNKRNQLFQILNSSGSKVGSSGALGRGTRLSGS